MENNPSFGLVTEGKTDQILIYNILHGFFNVNEIDVRELQPEKDETDKQRGQNFGGWEKVFDYCQSDNFKEAFKFIDYIIIQIDTDVSEEKHYDIKKYRGTKNELSILELIEVVKNKFIFDKIGEKFYNTYQDRIIFAIAVDSCECWFLPLLEENEDKKSETLGCLKRINRARKQKKQKEFSKEVSKGKNRTKTVKNVDVYREVSKEYIEHDVLIQTYEKNPSLKIFIEDLQSKGIEISEEDDWDS